MCLDVTHLEIAPEYMIILVFENGERRMFDMKPLLAKQPWRSLSDIKSFSMAKIEFGTVTWPGNIDIAPETLYDCSLPLKS